MDSNTVSSRIKARRIALNISQGELAEMLGYKTRSSVAKIELNTNGTPLSKLQDIADALKTTIAYLIGVTDDPNDTGVVQSMLKPDMPQSLGSLSDKSSIPLIKSIACGTPILAEQNVEMYVRVPSSWKADFALLCDGDHMNPTIKDGDIVCIRIQSEVESGEIAAVRTGDKITLKRFHLSDNTVILSAENPLYESHAYTGKALNKIHIEGKAVGICRGL